MTESADQQPENGCCFPIELCETHQLIAEVEDAIGHPIVMPWTKKGMTFEEFWASDEAWEI